MADEAVKAPNSKTRYRVLRPIQHGKKLLGEGDVVEFTDAQAGHLLLTQAIAIATGAIVDGKLVEIS